MKIILVFFTVVTLASALSCTQTYQCMEVSDNYNYVECRAGQCACKSELGFYGSATANDKCRCDSPSNVLWGQGNPYCKKCEHPSTIIFQDGIPRCVNPAECEQAANDAARQVIHRQKVTEIYTNLVYPTPLLILSGIKPIDHLFSADVKGRVSPVGVFTDFMLVEEYFYALASTPGSIVPSVNIKSLVSSGNKVAVEVDILFNQTATGHTYNLTQMGFYEFDSNDRAKSIDLVILNLGAAVDVPEVAQPLVIQQLCTALTTTCSNPDHDVGGHYTDFNDCVSFMNSIPFGSWNDAAQNTVVCRSLHSLLTFSRPEVHCPHAGKTGGLKCVPHAYTDYYQVDY